MKNDRGPFVQTYTGRIYYPLDPSPLDVDICDIAHSLSNICRFNGHTSYFYSVAHHSTLVSMIAESEHGLDAARAGLFHDAHEAYCGDIVRPMKESLKRCGMFSKLKHIDEMNHAAVRTRFNVPSGWDAEIKNIEARLLATEARDVMGGQTIPWDTGFDPYELKIMELSINKVTLDFLATFERLFGQDV